MRYRHRKCHCCHEWFLPQAHNAYHQRYCTRTECRSASKRVSQRRWVLKNRDHYRGRYNVQRVQSWRASHPDYTRHRRSRHRVLLKVRAWHIKPWFCRIHLQSQVPRTGALQDFKFFQSIGTTRLRITLAPALPEFMRISAVAC